jgi:hypothetical protein
MKAHSLLLIVSIFACAPLGLCGCSRDSPPEGKPVAAISDDTYFSRSATWYRMGSQLVVVDPNAPRVITMEPWHETIFSAADGEHTVGQFVTDMAAQYEGGGPAGLRDQIHGLIGVLVSEGIVRLHVEPKRLPPYFAIEASKQDPEILAAQMRADGLIK